MKKSVKKINTANQSSLLNAFVKIQIPKSDLKHIKGGEDTIIEEDIIHS